MIAKQDKVVLKAVGKGFAVVMGIYVVVVVFGLVWWQVWLGLCVWSAWRYWRRNAFKLKKWLMSCGLSFAFINAYRLASTLGWLGWVLTITLILFWLLYFRWDSYLAGLHYAQRQLFGQEFYKFKEQGRPLPKIKLRWR